MATDTKLRHSDSLNGDDRFASMRSRFSMPSLATYRQRSERRMPLPVAALTVRIMRSTVTGM
jgi:hypothetical protein